MARPTTALRLRDIDPAEFGVEVERLVNDHAVSLLMALSVDAQWTIPEHGRVLGREATMLAMYAKAAEDAWSMARDLSHGPSRRWERVIARAFFRMARCIYTAEAKTMTNGAR